jgi:hypothetical protein
VSAAARLVGATVASYAAGWLLGVPALVPVINAAAGYPFMIEPVRQGRLGMAVGRMLVWALCMGACATAMAYARPAATSRLFLNAAAYEREMFTWVATGEGRESRPREFVRQHVAHAAVFAGLSLATGSALSMPMGAALVNYMGHYVGSLARHGRSPWLLVAAWHPWSVIRVTSFVILGVVLSGPVLCAARGARWRWDGEARRWTLIAMAGLVADVLLKTSLAPVWRRLLISLAGW